MEWWGWYLFGVLTGSIIIGTAVLFTPQKRHKNEDRKRL